MQDTFIYSSKNNFAGGELTPTIEGRTELSLYQHGVKKLTNFILLPPGGITRRAGTRYLTHFAENFPKKIISVMFSRKLSYVLAFESKPHSSGCMFFIDGLPLNGIVLKHNKANFTFKIKDFSYVVFQGAAYISFGSNLPIFKFSIDLEVLDKYYEKINSFENNNLSHNNPNSANSNNPYADFNLQKIEAAREFFKENKLFIIEPLKCKVNYFKALKSRYLTSQSPKQQPFNEVIYNADIDKINDELKALHDDSANNIYEKSEENLRCKTITVFENRLWCFGANNNIHSIWASYKGDFSDYRMAYKSLLEARNPLTAFSATFSSSTFDNVLWSIPFSQELLLGTSDGIYVVKEGDRAKGEFIKIHKEIDISVSPIKPVILGKTIFFVEGNMRKINSLFYSQEKGGYQIADITVYAEHIFTSGITEIAGINSPFSMIFAVLRDGTFASFTYSEGLKIMGWARHYLGGGSSGAHVLSIIPVCGKESDLLYFHVRREKRPKLDTDSRDNKDNSNPNHNTNPNHNSNNNNLNYREYLEVLDTAHFSAKEDSGRGIRYASSPSYIDCHITAHSNFVNDQGTIIMDAKSCVYTQDSLSYDRIVEHKHKITKLEDIIGSYKIMQSLDLTNIDIRASFKYRGKLLSSYPLAERKAAELFIKTYYKDYYPIILETISASFAYLRLISKIYAALENIFRGDASSISLLQEEIISARYYANEIADNIRKIRDLEEKQNSLGHNNTERNTPEQNPILGKSNFSHKYIDIIEYIPNDNYSFDISIIKQLSSLDTRVISDLNYACEDILKGAKVIIEQNSNPQELNEMRISIATLELTLLEYYVKCEYDKTQNLQVNIERFFTQKDIGFYNKLKEISHPILTPYITRILPAFVLNKTKDLNLNTTKAVFKAKLREIIKEIFIKLEQELNKAKAEEITSNKRKEEILTLINEYLGSRINDENLNYLKSEFREVLNNIAANYKREAASRNNDIDATSASSANINANSSTTAASSQDANAGANDSNKESVNTNTDANANAQTSDKDKEKDKEKGAGSNTSSSYSDQSREAKYQDLKTRKMPDPPKNAKEMSDLMLNLKEAIVRFREYLIDCANLIMPKSNRILLKSILEDENNIMLEKHLISDKKYFPLFKKIFPHLANYDIANIIQNTMPSFRIIEIKGIANIYANIRVAIIGDNSLKEFKNLDSDVLVLKELIRHVAIGFPYKSIMQTFPLIFPEEVEHMPKFDCEIGIKLYNTGGGYIEEELEGGQIERQYVNSGHMNIDLDNLKHYMGSKADKGSGYFGAKGYLGIKEVAEVLGNASGPGSYTSSSSSLAPCSSAWAHFTTVSGISPDVTCTFAVDEPIAASVLKIYAKAKVLQGYRGM